IAPAHIENLGSLEKIAQAKLEIIEGLAPQGTIILNADDSVLASEFAKLPRRKGQVLYFGTGDAVQSSVSSVVSRGLEGIGFELTLFGERAHITMKVMGKQNAMNGACAALCARTLYPDLGIDQIRAGLSNFQAPLMRLNVRTLEDERIIIDDSYNANPASMKALVELAGELGDGKKRVGLVLGDMLELGEDSERFHLELGRQAAGINPHFLISVGKFAAAVAATAKAQQIPVFEAANAEQACSIAGSQQFDILLIKASRGVGLDKVVKHLCGDH
ncbi:MAG: hypothetical protein DCC75_02315, partial [Proteobacteria bacterium]